MNEFQECIEERKLIQVSYAKTLIPKEIKEAEEDLQDAQDSYARERYKWCEI